MNIMYEIRSEYKKLIADVVTPVSLYLKLRDKYANSILLESSDYHAAENSFSYICCNPIASFILKDKNITITYPGQVKERIEIKDKKEAITGLGQFMKSFLHKEFGFNFITNGLFGYVAYDAVEYFEDIDFVAKDKDPYVIRFTGM
jgi:anthranilate synthase component 1